MAKTIITQMDEVLNYENIVLIYISSAPVEDAESEEEVIFIMFADTVNGDSVPIGFYDEEGEANEAKDKLVEWLQREMYGVYRLDRKEGD